MTKPRLRDRPIADTIARMKTEIIADVRAGRIPATVRSFSELHDYVDANEYGGLTSDAYQWSAASEADTAYANAAQAAVHDWIAFGSFERDIR